MEENLDINNEVNRELSENSIKTNSDEIKVTRSEKVTKMDNNNGGPQINSAPKDGMKNEIEPPVKTIIKPKKELPIEKKPFQEFINIH